MANIRWNKELDAIYAVYEKVANEKLKHHNVERREYFLKGQLNGITDVAQALYPDKQIVDMFTNRYMSENY